ncbi:tagaturonate epimerase family protein [Brachybacterium sp. J153]|uniref:tagaturonate epimerase family protein n=1 Tax=Brachybacterium sp. J153 TaxID=3116488 RepID=UPI002E7635D5|nr:tagaturonate epimerase family protein [Brachybacterium sp. J153]MEE1619407.1 tagaturonate epimerase family protein [Brachybacterium sp. J153]
MTLRTDALEADIHYDGAVRSLHVRAAAADALAPFEGEIRPDGEAHLLEGPLSTANAKALQDAFEVLRPQLISRHRTSVGTGDRIGLAGPGQAAAFAAHGQGVMPVLAQQSIREMDRLGRSARTVMDEAVFGLLEAGWEGGFGADCDHIKTTEGIDRGLEAGFVMFTLDPGDHVADVTGGVTAADAASLPWDALEDTLEQTLARYADLTLDVGHSRIEVTEQDVITAAVKYGAAVAEAIRLYRHAMENARHEIEIEFAVDETAWLTTFFEHFYLATELKRLGASWFSFAPRYVDGFEKGLDFLGDPEELRRNLEAHHAISEQFGGYRISLHSGSDKFSIYPLCVEATQGHVHLKTSGTSYLCALEVIAAHDPELFATIWEISRASYVKARASYQVSAHEDRTPTTLEGVDLTELIRSDDARQILHVGYGDSLNAALPSGESIHDRFLRVVAAHQEEHTAVVAEHIGRHLAPFSAGAGA